METGRCPGCSGRGTEERIEGVLVLRCESCGGIFSETPMTQDAARRIIGTGWCRHEGVREVYFDLTVFAMEPGRDFDRWHGWYHPGCGITQTG